MKFVTSLVAVTGLLLLVLLSAPTALASHGWGLEDPQLCVNGHLLTVLPAKPASVFVSVPRSANVDFRVENCGGKSKLGVVPASNVTYQGSGKMGVTAFVSDGTEVTFSWNAETLSDVADAGRASVSFTMK